MSSHLGKDTGEHHDDCACRPNQNCLKPFCSNEQFFELDMNLGLYRGYILLQLSDARINLVKSFGDGGCCGHMLIPHNSLTRDQIIAQAVLELEGACRGHANLQDPFDL